MKKRSSVFIFILSLFLFSCANQITPMKEEKGCISIALPGNSVGRAVSMTDIIVEAPETYYISVHRGENTEGPLVSLQSDLRPGAVFELTDLETGTYTIYIKAMSKKNIFEQTKTVDIKAGNNKVVINLEHSTGAVSFRFTGTKVSKEYPLIINFTNSSTGFDRQIKIPETDPDGTFTIYHMPEGTYKMTIEPRKYFQYKYSESVEVKNGKITSVYPIEAIPVFYVNSNANDSSEQGTEKSPFKTIDKAIEKMNYLNLSEGTIYISGSVPTFLVLDPSSKITNLIIEKAPGATTAELVSTKQNRAEPSTSAEIASAPIFAILRSDATVTLKDITLRLTENGSKSAGAVILNEGTCSMTNIDFIVPEITGTPENPADSQTTLISSRPEGNLKIGGKFNMPEKTRICLETETDKGGTTVTNNSKITITEPLVIADWFKNPVRIDIGSTYITGTTYILAENNVNLNYERGKLSVYKLFNTISDKDVKYSDYGFDEQGQLIKTQTPLYIQSDIGGTCTYKLDGEENPTTLDSLTENTPTMLGTDHCTPSFSVGSHVTVELSITSADGSTITQKHKITPVGTGKNIIKVYTNNDVYVSTDGSDTNNGLSDKPVKTVSRAVELMEEKILNPTFISSTPSSRSAPSIILKGAQTFTETAPITIDKAVKFEIVNIDGQRVDNATISNGTTDNEIFIINNPNADITLGKRITLDSGFTTNSTKCLIKVVQGKLNIEQHCVIGYEETKMNGIYVSKDANVTIKGIDTDVSPSILPINKPIYLENGASITAAFGILERKIPLILADDYEKQTYKPVHTASGNLTNNQIIAFCFVTNEDKVNPTGGVIDKTGYYRDSVDVAYAQELITTSGSKYIVLKVYVADSDSSITEMGNLATAIKNKGGLISLKLQAPKLTSIPENWLSTTDGSGDNLINIELPSNITTIGASAFEGCTRLTSVIFEDTTNTWTATPHTSSVSETVQTLDVSNEKTNAENLIRTYAQYTWTKNK